MPESPDSGDAAFHSTDTLMPSVYAELRRLAASRILKTPGQSLSGTVLVHAPGCAKSFYRVRKRGS